MALLLIISAMPSRFAVPLLILGSLSTLFDPGSERCVRFKGISPSHAFCGVFCSAFALEQKAHPHKLQYGSNKPSVNERP